MRWFWPVSSPQCSDGRHAWPWVLCGLPPIYFCRLVKCHTQHTRIWLCHSHAHTYYKRASVVVSTVGVCVRFSADPDSGLGQTPPPQTHMGWGLLLDQGPSLGAGHHHQNLLPGLHSLRVCVSRRVREFDAEKLSCSGCILSTVPPPVLRIERTTGWLVGGWNVCYVGHVSG